MSSQLRLRSEFFLSDNDNSCDTGALARVRARQRTPSPPVADPPDDPPDDEPSESPDPGILNDYQGEESE